MNKYICVILSLKECMVQHFGNHYPIEIIQVIFMKFYKPSKVNYGMGNIILIDDNIYLLDDDVSCRLLLSDINTIVSSNYHIVALTSHDEIYSWGNNHFGQLGLGTNSASD